MSKRKSYNTKQKNIILEEIQNQKKEFTVKDIYSKLENQVGLTTIYRLIDKLVEDGKLSKNIDNNIPYYQYLEECEEKNHFYLKCKKCKKMIHIDCDCIENLSTHIKKNHQFQLDKEHIIINGYCNKCKKYL